MSLSAILREGNSFHDRVILEDFQAPTGSFPRGPLKQERHDSSLVSKVPSTDPQLVMVVRGGGGVGQRRRLEKGRQVTG